MYTDKDIGRVCSRDGSPMRDELGQRTVVYLRIRPCMSFNSHKETAGDRLPSLQSSKRGFSLGWSVLTINSAIVKRRKPNISSRTLHKRSSQNWMQTINRPTYTIWDPNNFRGRVRVVERRSHHKFSRFFVEIYNLHLKKKNNITACNQLRGRYRS